MRYTRLVACDLDNTLLDNSSNLTASTCAMLRSALADGTTALTISTGRQLLSLHGYIRQLGLTDVPIIAETGAVLFDPVSYDIIREWVLPHSVIADVMHLLGQHDWGCTAYFIRGERVQALVRPGGAVTADMEYDGIPGLAAPLPLDEWPGVMRQEQWRKICILGPAPKLKELDDAMHARLGETARIERPSDECMDIMAAGVSKGLALAIVSSFLGVQPEHVMAIGDSPIDISMLAVAGVPVAVQNAWPEVKERARYIAPSNEEDGVAVAVTEFVCGRYHAAERGSASGDGTSR
ncbi:MAG: Cof-type HAD-IIB family hydrolase [Candidatus Cryosericum sp.]